MAKIKRNPIQTCIFFRLSCLLSCLVLLSFSKLKHFILNGLQSLRSKLHSIHYMCSAQISIPFICSNFFFVLSSIVTQPCCCCYSFICTIVSQMNLAVSNITTVTDMSSSSAFVCAPSPVVVVGGGGGGNIYMVDSGGKMATKEYVPTGGRNKKREIL